MAELIYTTQDVLEWLATQPDASTFDYSDPCDCLFARFLRAECLTSVIVFGGDPDTWRAWRGGEECCGEAPPLVHDVAQILGGIRGKHYGVNTIYHARLALSALLAIETPASLDARVRDHLANERYTPGEKEYLV